MNPVLREVFKLVAVGVGTIAVLEITDRLFGWAEKLGAPPRWRR